MPNVVGNRRLVFTGSYLDPDAASYIARAGITDATEISAVNTFVKACKATPTIWAAMQGGICYLISPTSFGASVNNLLSSSFTATAGASPSYSTSGWTFNGTTQYLKTGLIVSTTIPANQGFILVDLSAYTAGNSPIAATVSSTQQFRVFPNNGTNNAFLFAYDSSSLSAANAATSGTYVFGILASNSRYIRMNGVNIGTSSAAIGGTRPNIEFYIGASNSAGSAAAFSASTMRTVMICPGILSTADADTLVGFVNTYNATVISGGR